MQGLSAAVCNAALLHILTERCALHAVVGAQHICRAKLRSNYLATLYLLAHIYVGSHSSTASNPAAPPCYASGKEQRAEGNGWSPSRQSQVPKR